EADLMRVKKGYEVTFKTAGASDARFKAEITYVSNHVRKMTREAEVEALVTNEPVKLAHGMFVEGEIILGTIEAFAVPYKALMDNRYLMLSVNEKAVRKMCENTERASDFVIITDGCIKPGDLVIVEGQSIIEEGNKIKIVGTSQY
ncbi:MAG: HlyD family efflux transporter periplasmic adaptor subunit, partial [Victivallales bacterium]|nr:HlyD family efflux transporter periplasmic adaptor subunit [Victivallales bacterium]